MRKFLVRTGLGLALVLGVLQAPAHAGTTSVTYAVTGTISIPGIGPIVPVGAGTVTITFPTLSASYTTILPGAVHVAAFTFGGPIAVLGSLAHGAIAITGGSMAGTLGPGGTLGFAFAAHVAAGFIHCFAGPATCGGVGLPSSVPVPLTSLPLGGPLLGTVGMGNPSTIAIGSGAIGTFGGSTLLLAFSGTEVSRTHPTPEPGMLGLFGTAAVGLLAYGARRLRS